jgi:hypothetical protein
MRERVRELRARLGHVLLVLSDPLRRDLEELFDIASSIDGRAPVADKARGGKRQSLAEILSEVLRNAGGPMRIGPLTKAARANGWQTKAKDPRQLVRKVLLDPPFARTKRGAYVFAPDESRSPRPKLDRAPDPSSVRARIGALLRSEGRPMKPGEIASALLASGWETKSPRPTNVVSAVVCGYPDFVAVDGGYALRDAGAGEVRPPASRAPASRGRASRAPASRARAPKEPAARTRRATAARSPQEGAVRSGLSTQIHALLSARGAPMSTREIVDALRKGGWKTKSKSPGAVVSAAVAAEPSLTAVTRGVYGIRDWNLEKHAVEAARDSEANTGMRARIRRVLERRGAPMRFKDITEELASEGWTTRSDRPRDVVASAIRASDEFEIVDRATAGLRKWSSGAARPAIVEVAAPRDERPPRERPPAIRSAEAVVEEESGIYERSPESTALDVELGFLLRHVADARPDAAVLAPLYQRKQLTAWIARARAISDRGGGRREVVRSTGKVAAELSALAKLWWPGSVEALKLQASPADALAPFAKDVDGAELTWEIVADRLDAQMEGAYDDPHFDDGWNDTRWLCDDERFAGSHLDHAETLLARAGTPLAEPPGNRASLRIDAKSLRDLVQAARGLRWVRGVATDGLRWGLCMGRMRWIAAGHPLARESALPHVLAAEYQPLGAGWGFDEELRHEKRQWLATELALVTEADLPAWLMRAIDVFDNPDLASLLSARRGELARIDPARLESRRARSRIRKLVEAMGVVVSAPAAGPSVPEVDREPEAMPRFASARALIGERLSGNRTLFISNRADPSLEETLASAFGLDIDWCVATPRRVDAAASSIRNGKYDLILSATGFQTHAMDATFARAAHDSTTPYIRVNRGRPTACARAIERELGASSSRQASRAADAR